ncbi:MAG: indole-3-glycerol phosphate synthase TrpC [bacterium]
MSYSDQNMGILDEIVKHKKIELSERIKSTPITALLEQAKSQSPPTSFFKALTKKEAVQVIAEVKKASPSAGELRANFDPVSIAKSYQANGAAAVSVLTDEKFFQGKLEYLQQIHNEILLPLLRKDFFLEPYQVIEAKAYGASAILLIVAILSNEQIAEIYSTAREHHLDCLVEVHNATELERALMIKPRIVGVNNRDLATFEVDLATTEKLLALIPAEVVVVSESGIQTRQQVEQLGALGVDAVLVGSSLMQRQDIGRGLRELVGVHKWSR